MSYNDDLMKRMKDAEEAYKNRDTAPKAVTHTDDFLKSGFRWKKTMKKDYFVYCRQFPIGTVIYNYLEDCIYEIKSEDEFVISGTRDEKYVVTYDKLISKYRFDFTSGLEIASPKARSLFKDGWVRIYAVTGTERYEATLIPYPEQKNAVMAVDFGNGTCSFNKDGIPHGKGDFIIRDTDGTMHPVNGIVFVDTYIIDNFVDDIDTEAARDDKRITPTRIGVFEVKGDGLALLGNAAKF